MEEKFTFNGQTEQPFPFFAIVYRRAIMIILITVLCAMLSFAYCLTSVKPTYTATNSLMLRMSVGNDSAGTVTTNVSLSKLYLSDVVKIIKSPKVIDYANEVYDGEGSINSGAISVSTDEESLIFSISYTDLSTEQAKEKLAMVITCASEVLSSGAIEAESISLIPTQKDSKVREDSGFVKYIVLGTTAGLVFSVLLAMLMYALDSSVNDRKEFEELTGVSVLAYISQPKQKK